jgi:hypothetical protein
VRFVDFLRATVLLSAASATALGAVTALAIAGGSETSVLYVAIGWWVVATVIGLRMSRRAETNPPISRLLAGARASTMLPELNAAAVLVNRLWPLLVFTLVAGVVAFLAPQVPAIAAGFAIIWALSWRRQDAAVRAIEERDGATFFVQRTSPLRPMSLERTPGFKALRPERNGVVT